MTRRRRGKLFQYVHTIRKEVAAGTPVGDLAAMYNVTVQAIRSAVYEGGSYDYIPGALPKDSTRLAQLPPEAVVAVRRMYDENKYSIDEIASRMGISTEWVSQIGLRKARLDVEPVGTPARRAERYSAEVLEAVKKEAQEWVGVDGRWAAWQEIAEEYGMTQIHVYYLATGKRGVSSDEEDEDE